MNFVRLLVCLPSLTDISGNLPNECGMVNLVSNDKGCYPGQEIVSRVYHNRVISKKKFMRLAYTGSPKSQGTKLFQDKKEVGFLGSNANGFCLAYTNREFASNRYEVKHDELINISA